VQVADTLTVDKGVTIDGIGTVTDNYNGEGNELIDNKGTINADVNGVISSPSWTNAADGTISAASSGTTVDLVGGTVFGTVKIAAGATVEATGGSSNPTTIGGGATATVVKDQGILLATAGTTLTLGSNTTVNATISLNAITHDIVGGLTEAFDAAATVVLDGATINTAAFETQTDGVITTQAGSNTTLNGVTIVAGTTVDVVDTSTVTLEGTITDQGSIAVGSAAGATLAIAPVGKITGVTLLGGGSVVLSDSTGNLIAAASGMTATLTNAKDVISGAGMIGNSGDGKLTLVNGGTIDATGVNALTIDTGHTVTNTGTLEATGGGKLIVDDSVSGSSGKALIASASTIELAGTLNTAAVSFENNGGNHTGILVLDNTTDGFHGTIAGFFHDDAAAGSSDTLDLKDITNGANEKWTFTQSTLTKGVLTVDDTADGGGKVTISLLGQYLAAAGKSASSGSSTLFALNADSGTGTLVTTTHT
jgi:hypothetical protein